MQPGDDLRTRYRTYQQQASVSPSSVLGAPTPELMVGTPGSLETAASAQEMPPAGSSAPVLQDLSGGVVQAPSMISQPRSLLRFNKWALLFAGAAMILVVSTGVVTLVVAGLHSGSKSSLNNQTGKHSPNNFAVSSLDVNGLPGSDQLLNVSKASSLDINGDLQVGSTVVLTPTATPTTPKTGQLYYDKVTNQAYMYNGTAFVQLGGGVNSLGGASGDVALGQGLQLSNNRLTLSGTLLAAIQSLQQLPSAFVTSLQGKTGAVSFSGGKGIAVSGTTIINTGVVDLQSGSSAITVKNNGGVYTLSAPASLVTGSGTSGTIALFSAGSGVSDSILTQSGSTVSLGGDLQVSGGISYNGSGELNISATSSQIVFNSGNAIYTFPAGLTGDQTICVTNMDCSTGGGGAYVQLGPSAVQSYTGSGSAIAIDDTGSGNLLQIQSSGLDRLVVANNGDTTIHGNFTATGMINGATISGGDISGGKVNGADISGGTLSGGSLTDTTVNGLNVSSTAIAGNGALGISAATDQNLSLNTSGVGVIMIGSSALQGTGALNIFAGGTDQNLNLAGSGAGNVVVQSPVFHNANGATYSFDTADASGATATICTTLGNCSGASGNGVTSTGTTGYLPIFGSDGYHLDNSILSQDAGATTLSVAGALSTLGDITVSGNGSVLGTLTANVFSGNGSGLTNVNAATLNGQGGSYYTNASNLSSGTVADGRLSTNVTLLGNTFNGPSQLVQLGANGYLPALNASQLLNINGSAITSGIVANSYLTGGGALSVLAGSGLTGGGSVALGGSTTLGLANTGVTANTYGSASSVAVFTVNAQGQITSATTTAIAIDGSQVTTGTVSDGRLSANVAKYNDSTANFTGALQQNGNTVCTTAGNCVGSGSGGAIGGSGTAGQLAMFTGSGFTLSDSLLGQSVGVITDSGSLAVQGSGGLVLGVAGPAGTNGLVTFNNAAGAHTVSLQAPASDPGSNLIFKLPSSYGSNGNCLQSDGAGGLVFQNCTGGAGGGVTSLDAQTGTLTLNNSTASGGVITVNNAQADGTTKGIAAFSASQFLASSGVISVKAGGITGTEIAGSTVANSNLVNSSLSVTAGTNLTGGGSVALGGSITLNVANSPVFSGTLAVQGASATIGSGTQAGSLVLHSGNGAANTATIKTVGTLGQATTYLLPDVGGANTTICTNSGNCIGAPGGAIASSGSSNYIPVFGSDGYHLNNSILSQDSGATLLNINGSVSSTGSLTTSGAINGATISGGTLSGGVVSGGSLSAAQVNGLNVSSSAISSAAALSISAAANQNLTISSSGSGNVVIQTPQFKNANGAVYSFNSADTSAVTSQICTTAGNCVGSGGGGVSSTGSSGFVALFGADGYHLGSSVISQSGGAISVGGQLTATSTVTLSGLTTAGIVHNNASGVLSTSLITNGDLQGGTYSAITGTGALQAGSITTGFGTIVTSNSITGTVLNATTGLQTGGITRLDSSGALQSITGYSQTAGNFSMSGGNFTQSGGGTFSTGTGAVSLNGATTVNNTLTVTSSTTLQGTVTLSGTQLTNSGSTLNTALSLGNFSGSGSIGSAATTVDSHTSIAIAQTTAGQTLTLPSPTVTTAGRVVYVLNTGTAAFTMGGITVPAGYGQVFIWNGSSWTLGANGAGTSLSLQGAYAGGNTINTTNATDIKFTLADTATDANFITNIATGSTGQFKIQNNGSNILTMGSSGQLSLAVQGATGGLAIGTDTLAYRSGANRLQMNNALTLRNTTDSTTALDIQNAAGADVVTVDTVNKVLSVGTAATYGVLAYNGFSVAASYTASSSGLATDVITTDLNGDGKLDLVVGISSTVSVLLGNGDGTFQPHMNYTVSAAWSIAAADVNGDGKVDVVAANNTGNAYSVLLGNGDGTFQPVTNYSTGVPSAPYSITAIDVNGDGKTDLITANSSSNTAAVLLGNGDGTFQPKVDYAVGTNPQSVTAADLNGDGKIDLATSNYTSSTLSVLLGNGDGTFQPKVDYTTSANPQSVTAADLNGDGKLDLISGGGSTLSVLLGNGDGTFQPKVDYTTSGNLKFIIAIDVNNDNKLDLVAGGIGVSVLLGNGDGTFQPKVDYDSGDSVYSVAAADFNGDGRPDLATANYTAKTTTVLLNNPALLSISGALSSTASSVNTAALMLQAAAGQSVDIFHVQNSSQLMLFGISQNGNVGIGNIANLNSSSSLLNVAGGAQFQGGIVDKVASGYTGNLLDLQVNGTSKLKVDRSGNLSVAGQGIFSASLTVNTATNSTAAFRVQDAGGTNVLAVDTTTKSLNVGSTTLTYSAITYAAGLATATDYATGASPRMAATADFNGDGKPDLATANATSNTVSVLRGNGDGTFQAKVDYPVGTSPQAITAADLNGDGKADLAVANTSSNTVSILLGNGDGTFQAKVDYATGSGPDSVTVADVNGDGKPDLVVANNSSNTVSILLGNGDGTFQAKVDYATSTNPGFVAAADFNGDGKLDLVVANIGSNTVSILLGNGNGTFQAKVDIITTSNANSVTTADFNSDGKMDFAVTNYGSAKISVFLGNGNGTFQAGVTYTTGTSPQFVTAADFNGDGKLDLAVANFSSNTASVFLGNGDGTFQAKVDYTTGTGPIAIAAADFNGDGKADVVVTDRTANTVSILLNNSVASSQTATGTLNAQASGVNNTALLLQGISGQSADIFHVQNSSQLMLFGISQNGNVGIGNIANLSGSSSLLNVAGGAQFQGGIVDKVASGYTGNLLDLQVNGTSKLKVDQAGNTTIAGTLTVTGAVTLSSTLTVTGATTVASITVNGHIIGGGTTPTIAAGVGACTTPTVGVTGTDTAGTITITTGTGCASNGKLATLTFASAFTSAPRVTLTSANANAAGLSTYVDSSTITTTAFDIDAVTTPTDSTSYVWYYHAIQ